MMLTNLPLCTQNEPQLEIVAFLSALVCLQAMRDTRDVVGDDVDSGALFEAAHAAATSLAETTRCPVYVRNPLVNALLS